MGDMITVTRYTIRREQNVVAGACTVIVFDSALQHQGLVSLQSMGIFSNGLDDGGYSKGNRLFECRTVLIGPVGRNGRNIVKILLKFYFLV